MLATCLRAEAPAVRIGGRRVVAVAGSRRLHCARTLLEGVVVAATVPGSEGRRQPTVGGAQRHPTRASPNVTTRVMPLVVIAIVPMPLSLLPGRPAADEERLLLDGENVAADQQGTKTRSA